MSVSRMRGRIVPIAAALMLGASLAGCSGFITERTEGYVISDDALKQVRTGQSKELVETVLGSPQVTNTFGNQEAYYYIQTKVEQTAFGLRNVTDRKVLAVYFDNNDRVEDRTLYGLEDGKVIDVETRRTPSYGEDRTFVESIIASF